ncbi:DUF6053 domain-containing protein [Lysobacter sp. CA199]
MGGPSGPTRFDPIWPKSVGPEGPPTKDFWLQLWA